TAAANGVIRRATLTVRPPMITALRISPTEVTGGVTATATILLSGPAPSLGLNVSITQSGSSAVSAPSQVIVGASQSSATFQINTVVVSAVQTANFSAALNGSSASATLVIQPPPVALATLSLQPSTVVGGLTANGVLTLTNPAPSLGATISVSSSDSSVATVPTSVVIPPGVTSGSFTIGTS